MIGIQTDKIWEKKSDAHWILKTGFIDPVTGEYMAYVLEFEKTDSLIILSTITFNNRVSHIRKRQASRSR